MKFQRNARILRNHMDIAPVGGMFFCLLIFLVLTALVYTPGVEISLPTSDSMVSGVEFPALSVAMTSTGQLYSQNAPISETNFWKMLSEEKQSHQDPVTLVVYADKAVTLEQLNHLRDLAYSAGIEHISQQVLPRIYDSPADKSKP